MQSLIIKFSILISFYVLGAYATTDILRLTKYYNIAIKSSKCYCPSCQIPIRISDQIPIFSYIKNKGRCKNCNAKIPKIEFFLELFLFVFISLCTICLYFSDISFLVCIIVYETTKLSVIICIGPRKNNFKQELSLSIFHNIIIFGLIAFLFMLKNIIQKGIGI